MRLLYEVLEARIGGQKRSCTKSSRFEGHWSGWSSARSQTEDHPAAMKPGQGTPCEAEAPGR